MRFILSKANFSGTGKNIGTLNSWFISKNTPSGLTWTSIPSSVDKGSNFNAVAEIDTANYELVTMSVTMGATTQSGVGTSGGITISKSGSRYTITISSVTANVNISVTTRNLSTGMPDSGGSGGGSTTYTFTVNPTPSTATVTLSATGYSTVSGTGSKSITVANNTTVNWSVSASGYTTRTGNWTINGGNKTESITLTAASGGGGGGGAAEIDISSLFTSNWQQGAMIIDSAKANYPGPQTNQTAYRCNKAWVDISAYASTINSGAKLQITMSRAINTNHQMYGLIFYSEAVKDATKVLGTLAMQYAPTDFNVYSVETREIEIPSGTKYVRTTWLPETKETELGAIFSAKIIPN